MARRGGKRSPSALSHVSTSSSSPVAPPSKKETESLAEFFKKQNELPEEAPKPTQTPDEIHEEFKRKLKEFFITHIPVYGRVLLKYGLLPTILLWFVLSFGVFGYVYKAFSFSALVYENSKAPINDLVVVEKIMDAEMDHYIEIPEDKDEPIVRHPIPFLEMFNARYIIIRGLVEVEKEPNDEEEETIEGEEDDESPPSTPEFERSIYESSFWQCFSMVHLIGAGAVQTIICGVVMSGYIFYYIFAYRVFALLNRIPLVARIQQDPTLFIVWYSFVGIIAFGYAYKILVYSLAVFNTIFIPKSQFTVKDLGLNPNNYNIFLSIASASFDIVSDDRGIKYFSNSFWSFWDGAHILGAFGIQAIACIAVPVYYLASKVFWFSLKLFFTPILNQFSYVSTKVKRD